MADMSENLRQLIITKTSTTLGSTYIGNRVHQDVVPQHQRDNYPRVWFRRDSQDQEVMLGLERGPIDATFDVECISDVQSEAITIADNLRDHMSVYLGTAGQSTTDTVVKGSYVEDVDDTYLPSGIADDEGAQVSALRLRLVYTT